MNENWMLKPLMDLGLTETEALVYLYLTKEGPKNVREVGEALKLYRQQLYRSLGKMQSKGIVKASQEYPARFSAVPFDKVLDIFIEVNIEEAKYLMKNKKELLSSWRSITETDRG